MFTYILNKCMYAYIHIHITEDSTAADPVFATYHVYIYIAYMYVYINSIHVYIHIEHINVYIYSYIYN